MNNFQAIKEMSIREMTGFLYTFLLPWTKAYNKEQKETLWSMIEQFLKNDVQKVRKEDET